MKINAKMGGVNVKLFDNPQRVREASGHSQTCVLPCKVLYAHTADHVLKNNMVLIACTA
jgi:hypothetical protein